MKSYGCVKCWDEEFKSNQTSNSDERFIIPYSHAIYCEKHRPKGSIPLTELLVVGNSWANWRKAQLEIARTK